MNKFLFFLFSFISVFSYSQTTFKLMWDAEKLPFEIKTAAAPSNLKSRLGETGTLTEKINLPIQKQMPDGLITVNSAENAYVYLFIKNTSKKTIKFSVAPHSTHPGASALGFAFNCLCNGHIYTAEPNKVWYRIMSLKNSSLNKTKNVELMHHIFEVKNTEKK
jgi:hypothetical protein